MNVLTRWDWAWPYARRMQLRRRITRAALAAGGLWIAFVLVFGEAGLVRIAKLRAETRALEAEIAALETKARAQHASRDVVFEDPAALERIAREEYGLAREDEVVFKIRRTEAR